MTVSEKNQLALRNFVLHQADNSLILAQRLCAWCGHGPILEQDIALSNIALDLLGQAHNYYDYAAVLTGDGGTADSLSMLRTEREYKNLLLVELPNGDFGQTVARQFFFDAYHVRLLEQISGLATDLMLRAIAEKSLKEAKYHLRWSSEWVIRLGDGTEESHRRMQNAVDFLLPYLGEFFLPADYQQELIIAGALADPCDFQAAWTEQVEEILKEACLEADLQQTHVHSGGKQGVHTEHMGYLLAELQYMQRTYPGLEW